MSAADQLWNWPLTVTMVGFFLVVAFIAAVRVSAHSPASRIVEENRRLKQAIDDFLAAQEVAPGNWDAADDLRTWRNRFK